MERGSYETSKKIKKDNVKHLTIIFNGGRYTQRFAWNAGICR